MAEFATLPLRQGAGVGPRLQGWEGDEFDGEVVDDLAAKQRSFDNNDNSVLSLLFFTRPQKDLFYSINLSINSDTIQNGDGRKGI